MPSRIGVMGGTFDPIHLGHLRVAEEAVEMLSLDALLFIPAGSPPHKSGKGTLSFEHRWRMLQLALGDHPRFRFSDLEWRIPGKSYTVLTLQALHREIPDETELFFLVGLDAFLELDTWYHFKELFKLASIVALRRPGYSEHEIAIFLAGRVSPLYTMDADADYFRHPELLPVHYLRNTHLEISSTRIRRLVAEGRSIRYLVQDEVMSYIREKSLYRD